MEFKQNLEVKGSVVFAHTLVQYDITHYYVGVCLKKWVGRVEGLGHCLTPILMKINR